MKTCDEILRTLELHAGEINRFDVKRLGLFGSASRDETTDVSDLDFLVEFEQKSFDNYMELKFFLEELFDCSVDLVLVDSIKPQLRDRILKDVVDAPGLF